MAVNDLVAHEDVADAMIDERLGLADLLATDADGSKRHLLERDLGAFVRLGVWTQLYAPVSRGRGHAGEVVFERIEIDEQGRCVHLLERHPDRGRRVIVSHGVP